MNDKIFLLLIIFQIKHYMADFLLQGTYMLGKFKGGTEWIIPLSAHCFVHMTFTFIILIYFSMSSLWYLAAIDFILHFVMDRIKASPNIWGRYNFENKKYWYALGFDQMFHHLTHYFIIWRIVTV